MSNGVTEEPYEIRQTFYLKQKRNRTNERIEFLQRCKEEQVLPASAPAQLRSKEHPFTRAARVYLEDAIASLQDNDTVLKNRTPNTELPAHLKNRLKAESFEHRANLQKKLDKLCQSSDWNKAGNSSLITNLSDRDLTPTETAALSLGLKFDIGKPAARMQEFIIKNHRYGDSDLEKGFKQGVTACMTALASDRAPAIPKRFIKALEDLRNDPSIMITTADKGGGVVVMKKEDYGEKMKSLLQDSSTYESAKRGTCKKKSEVFTKEARRVLRRSTSGKKTATPFRGESCTPIDERTAEDA